MKRLIIISLSVIIMVSCSSKKQEIIGKWAYTTKKGNNNTMEFLKDGSMVTTVNGNPPTGIDSLHYTVNYNVKPNQVDLEFRDIMTGQPGVLKAIFEFKNDNELRMDLNKGDKITERPVTFDTANTVIMKRVSQ